MEPPEKPSTAAAQPGAEEPSSWRWGAEVGLVFFRDTWFAYYGQSDSTLGVATYKVGDTYTIEGSPTA